MTYLPGLGSGSTTCSFLVGGPPAERPMRVRLPAESTAYTFRSKSLLPSAQVTVTVAWLLPSSGAIVNSFSSQLAGVLQPPPPGADAVLSNVKFLVGGPLRSDTPP